MGVATVSNGVHEGCKIFEKATSADSRYEKKSEKMPSANGQVELHISFLPVSILVSAWCSTMMIVCCLPQQTIFGILRVSTSSKFASLFTHHDHMNTHKILGIFCLAHYIVRFAWLVVYGDMFFRPNFWSTWVLPAVHVLLSCSSFIFPIPLHRSDPFSMTLMEHIAG
jgi:hypothetical protein